MKTLYLDCGMGAAGDMLTAALLELIPDQDAFIEEVNALGIPGVQIKKETSVKCGIVGTHIAVTVDGEEEESHDHHDHHHSHTHDHHTHEHTHSHNSLHDIEHLVMDHLALSEKVKKDIMGVYHLLAEAESHAHGVPINQIHFHEVGTMDAVADIAAVCMLMEKIAPEAIVVSPVHVGFGKVHCAHGILPVPAPATAYILKNVPIYAGAIKGELCTPTGAALLKYFATEFGQMPVMKVEKTGYGMGKKDFEAANCVRTMLGETGTAADDEKDTVIELSCNVDDMTAEQIGFAMERLFEDGALDVYTVAIGMKKSRPGTAIHVMCKAQDREKMLQRIFKHTTTIGIREAVMNRYLLKRSIETVSTPYGDVRCKHSSGYGVSRDKYEYEDLARIAKEHDLGIEAVQDILRSVKKMQTANERSEK